MQKKKMNKKLKITLITICSIFLTVVLVIGGYLSYILISYHRIGNIELNVTRCSLLNEINVNEEYSCSTYNIGFGAYSQDYTFFLDEGYDENGNKTCGHYAKAKSRDAVLFNTNGAIKTIKDTKVDFALFQEVDIDSTRSYHIDQNEMILNSFASYDATFAKNFESAYLPYPLYDMHGKSNAGLTTISKYQITSSQRKEYTISNSLSKFFDLDRCFSVNTINVSNNKKLYLINSHMSAYDKGGTIRTKQIEELNNFINEVYSSGNYVIVGGDFNHDLLTYNPDFNYDMKTRPFNMTLKSPDWLQYFFNSDSTSPMSNNFKVVASDNFPTCRNNDIEWDNSKTFVCTVDGFIVSNNVEITNHYNIQTQNGNKNLDGFAYSDHDPSIITFKLK